MGELDTILSFRVDSKTLKKLNELVGNEDEENRSLFIRKLISKAYIIRNPEKYDSGDFMLTTSRTWAYIDDLGELFIHYYWKKYQRWVKRMRRKGKV